MVACDTCEAQTSLQNQLLECNRCSQVCFSGDVSTASATIPAHLTEPDNQQTTPSSTPVSMKDESTIGEIIEVTTKELTTTETSHISTRSKTEVMVTRSPGSYVTVSQQSFTDPTTTSTSFSASTDDNASTKAYQATTLQSTSSSRPVTTTTAASTNRVPVTSISSSPISTVAANYASSLWTTSNDVLESYTTTLRKLGITTRSAGYFASSQTTLGYSAAVTKRTNKKRYSWLRLMGLPSFSLKCWSSCVAEKEFFVTEECQECSQKLCRKKLSVTCICSAKTKCASCREKVNNVVCTICSRECVGAVADSDGTIRRSPNRRNPVRIVKGVREKRWRLRGKDRINKRPINRPVRQPPVRQRPVRQRPVRQRPVRQNVNRIKRLLRRGK